jgi:hypothetical protein
LGDLDIDGKYNNRIEGSRLDARDSKGIPAAYFCEHDNEPSDSITGLLCHD